jgi:hypothetical protein
MGEGRGIRRLSAEREKVFSQLADSGYEVTSDETGEYNCIAYAAGDQSRKWGCPAVPDRRYYWPPGARRGDELICLVSAFEVIGFEACDDPQPEEGFHKVVLYVDEYGWWQHAAKQIEGGHWSSKLGDWEDIKHANVNDVVCQDYGRAACYMRRPKGNT